MGTVPEAAKILLVDDEPESIKLISRMLAGIGQVRFATSGLEALSAFAPTRQTLSSPTSTCLACQA